MADQFTAAVKNWAAKTETRQASVLHQALRIMDDRIAEATPVVTGNLRNSRAVSSLARVAIDWRTKKFRDPGDAINNAIAGVEIGHTTWLGFRAPYAYSVERKHGFMRLVAQHWPEAVAEAAATARTP